MLIIACSNAETAEMSCNDMNVKKKAYSAVGRCIEVCVCVCGGGGGGGGGRQSGAEPRPSTLKGPINCN